MKEPRVAGENFSLGGVSLSNLYDRNEKSGYLNVDVESYATLDQRRAVALLIRQFADDLERD